VQPEQGRWQRTFTIITTQSESLIEPIHDRMPVILDERAAEDWMKSSRARFFATEIASSAGSRRQPHYDANNPEKNYS
jgi:putative SOS response-associated peptidase YedK